MLLGDDDEADSPLHQQCCGRVELVAVLVYELRGLNLYDEARSVTQRDQVIWHVRMLLSLTVEPVDPKRLRINVHDSSA
jgi:hypothetical protein